MNRNLKTTPTFRHTILLFITLITGMQSSHLYADEQRTLNFKLFEAAREGSAQEVKGLLQQGAAINARNRFGNTALLLAVRANKKEIAKTLLSAGADVTINNLNNISVVAAAAFNKDVELAEALISPGG